MFGNGCEAVFKLDCAEGAPQLRENFKFPASEFLKIKAALKAKMPNLCAEWIRIHDLP